MAVVVDLLLPLTERTPGYRGGNAVSSYAGCGGGGIGGPGGDGYYFGTGGGGSMSAGYGSNVSYYSGGNGGAGIDGAGGQGANFYVGYYSYGGDTCESAEPGRGTGRITPNEIFFGGGGGGGGGGYTQSSGLQLPLVAMVAPAVAVAVLATLLPLAGISTPA